MGIHPAVTRCMQCLFFSAAALAASGCAVFRPDPPTPTPPPTLTAVPSQTPTPLPTSTPTPLPTLTPSPTPEPGCAVEWAWQDSGLVITAVDVTRMDGLMTGDRILTIEGRLSLEVILEVEEDFTGVGEPAERRRQALGAILTSNHVLLLGVQHMEEPFYYFNLHPDCH